MIVTDPRVVYQLKRVLRARSGYELVIQDMQDGQMVRYTCILTSIDNDQAQATIVDVSECLLRDDAKHLVIAMANRRDKMELIVQKATECGLSHITIIPTHRSVIRQRNNNKWKRLESIIVEATEQSRSTQIPVLQRCDDWVELTLS